MIKRNVVLVSCLLVLASAQLGSSANDSYPEIRSLILEAEKASAGITALPDGSKPLSTAADLLARSGYLDDAMRVGARAGVPPEQFAFAQTLYGDLPGALKAVAAMRDLERMIFCSEKPTSAISVSWPGRSQSGSMSPAMSGAASRFAVSPALVSAHPPSARSDSPSKVTDVAELRLLFSEDTFAVMIVFADRL